MNTEEKMLFMFDGIHGDLGTLNREIFYDDEGNPAGISVQKNGYTAWSTSKIDILFDYMTLDWPSR